jgi:phosphoglycerate kinase
MTLQPLAKFDLSTTRKRLIMRVDFNVPLSSKGIILDDERIRAHIPSLEFFVNHGFQVILLAHLGRPKTEGLYDSALSLAPIAKHLQTLMPHTPIRFIPYKNHNNNQDIYDHIVSQAHKAQSPIVCIDNCRFIPGETTNAFSAFLNQLGDHFILDAFSVSHRAHGSVVGFTGPRYAGPLLTKEQNHLDIFLNQKTTHNRRIALVGGSKISTKISALTALAHRVDTLLIGGAMAHVFLAAKGIDIGPSYYEESGLSAAKDLLAQSPCPIILPIDAQLSTDISWDLTNRSLTDPIYDLGPQSIALFKDHLQNADQVLWNGPLGKYEQPPFDKATTQIGAHLQAQKTATLLGGGDTCGALKHISLWPGLTRCLAGGAFLDYVSKNGRLAGLC